MTTKEGVEVLIDREMKLQNLDQLFLFLTSILGFFFSLVYILFERIETVVGFLPILILGLFIPVYIGYIRGAILIDNLEERIRGWIYFVYGIVVYITEVVLSIIRRTLADMNIGFENISLLVVFAGGLILGYVVGRGKIHRWFCRNISAAFNQKTTTLTNKIHDDTAFSAFTLSLLMHGSFSIIFSVELDFLTIGFVVFTAASGIAIFAWSERDIRRFSSLLEFSEYVEVERQGVKSYVPSRIGRISLPISLILLTLSIISLDWENAFATLVMLVVGGLGIILYVLSVERTKISVEKKKRLMNKEMEMRLTQLLERLQPM